MPAVKSYVPSHRDLVRMNVDGSITLNVRVKKPNEVYLDLVTATILNVTSKYPVDGTLLIILPCHLAAIPKLTQYLSVVNNALHNFELAPIVQARGSFMTQAALNERSGRYDVTIEAGFPVIQLQFGGNHSVLIDRSNAAANARKT